MKRISCIPIFCCLALVALSAAPAAEGPLRGMLRERLADRIGQGVAPVEAKRLAAGEKITAPGRYEIHLQHGGRDRMALVQVPKAIDAAQPLPLVMALHGAGGGALHQADDANYGLITKSSEAGFVAVFPNGISDASNGLLATWNAGNCCARAREEKVDDVGFLRALAADVGTRLRIAPERVYAIGMSNGAMMAYRLACEAGDVFHGIMAVAGTDNTQRCAPRQPVPVLHIHAKDDPLVRFDGGPGDRATFGRQSTDFVAVPATIAKWVKLDHAAPTPKRVLEVPGAHCERYESTGTGSAVVQLCVTDSGGHSWPGGGATRAGGEPPSRAISANDLMWEFFSGTSKR
jgi:polyhydroxybutyrate depolymerase